MMISCLIGPSAGWPPSSRGSVHYRHCGAAHGAIVLPSGTDLLVILAATSGAAPGDPGAIARKRRMSSARDRARERLEPLGHLSGMANDGPRRRSALYFNWPTLVRKVRQLGPSLALLFLKHFRTTMSPWPRTCLHRRLASAPQAFAPFTRASSWA